MHSIWKNHHHQNNAAKGWTIVVYMDSTNTYDLFKLTPCPITCYQADTFPYRSDDSLISHLIFHPKNTTHIDKVLRTLFTSYDDDKKIMQDKCDVIARYTISAVY